MAIPGRPTSDIQTQPGHSPVPPYETPMHRVGRGSLDLVKTIDTLGPTDLSRSVNVRSVYGGALEVRPGQTALGTTTGTDRIHSFFRLNDPAASSFTRLAGSSTTLYRGQSGALTLIDSGYSGDPLTFAGANMPLSGTPFTFIGDRSRNRKVDRTNAVSVIGIPPGGLISLAVQAQLQKTICHFDAADSSAAASWTYTAGQDRSGNAAGAPTGADVLGAGDLLVQVTTTPGSASGGYDNIISIARTLNLTTFGAVDVEDDDMMHLRINVSDPANLEEIKIYFVTSAFTPGAIPGDSTNNTEAWFKSIRPNDFTDLHTRVESTLTAQAGLRQNELLQDFAEDQSVPNPRTSAAQNVIAGITETSRLQSPQFPAGQNVWGSFGILGIPLRRGDFSRVGQGQVGSTSWSTVTGIVIVIQTVTTAAIVITFADWDLEGGGHPDVSEPNAQAYDYRIRSYNVATGAKGNPSAVQVESAWVNPVRQKVILTPNAAFAPPDANVRQQAFRRGGGAATASDWFFVGQSASDGGTITDNSSDDEAIEEETLEIDNDQPVTSVDTSGATVLNQKVAVFFPVEDSMFALGDTRQPGRLYKSKAGYPESWPATEYRDVCAASEELMNGGQVATAGFVFSRTRMYSILLNSDGSWTTEPTACSEGLVGRWALAVTPFGIAFVSPFGVRLTQGGIPERLSDDWIEPLFRGETVRGLSPIDFTVPTALTLSYGDDELWVNYQDTGGTRRHLIYNFFSKNWRTYTFGTPVAGVYWEPVQGAAASCLLGSNAAGACYTHSGFSDLGSAIAYSFRTGAYDFGDPRVEKLLSEVVLDAELLTDTITMTAYLNDEITTVTAQTAVGVAGLRRYTFEPFGTSPQRARNVAIHIAANASTSARPYFNLLGVSRQLQPEITFNQPTPWEEMPGGEGYVWGCLITCDTGNVARSVVVEYTTNNGSITTAATLSVQADGRKKLPFSWSAVLAQQIRIRPTGTCEPWIRYKLEWLSDPEPPRLLGWDTNWEDMGTLADKWLKGYLLEADTFNAAKTVVIDLVDSNSAQQLASQSNSLTFNGRGVQHVSFAKLRGRMFRLRATDANFGKFYRWQPIFDEEPLALTRWETQERPFHGMNGRWQKPLEAFVSIRSSGPVNWQIITYGLSGTVLNTSNYTLLSTAGAKQKIRVPLNATKGLLFAHLFSSTAGSWIYREESEIMVEDFNTGEARLLPLWPSNDDLDPGRQMGVASARAQTPGGGG